MYLLSVFQQALINNEYLMFICVSRNDANLPALQRRVDRQAGTQAFIDFQAAFLSDQIIQSTLI